MAILADLYVKTETIETILKTLKDKNAKGVAFTIALNQDGGEYNQNVKAFVSQTKEQSEAKTPKFYVGNGKVFWNNGEVIPVMKKDGASNPISGNSQNQTPAPPPF